MADTPDTPQQAPDLSWENVGPEFAKQFPGLDPEAMKAHWEKSVKMTKARWATEGDVEDTGSWMRRKGLPFVSLGINVTDAVGYGRARKRIEAGQAADEDYHTVAEYEQRQQKDVEHRSTLGGALGEAAVTLPGMAAEFATGGGLIRAGGMAAGGRIAATLAPEAAKAAGIAVPKLLTSSGIAAAVARNAATTALVPTMYLNQAVQSNIAEGRDPMSWKGFPAAYGLGMVQVAILGSIGQQASKVIGRSGLAGAGLRAAFAGEAGVAESAVADIAGKWLHLSGNYGSVQDALDGKWGDAGRHAASQALTFAVFGAMHDRPNPEAPVAAHNNLMDAFMLKGQSKESAARKVAEVGDRLANALVDDPNMTQADAMARVAHLPVGPERDYATALAKALPETRPTEATEQAALQGKESAQVLPPRQTPPEGQEAREAEIRRLMGIPEPPKPGEPPQGSPEPPKPPPASPVAAPPPKTPREIVTDLEAANREANKRVSDAQRNLTAAEVEAALVGPGAEARNQKATEAKKAFKKATREYNRSLKDLDAARTLLPHEPDQPEPVTPSSQPLVQQEVQTKGHVAFNSPSAAETFAKGHPDWARESVGGEIRFKPPEPPKPAEVAKAPGSELEALEAKVRKSGLNPEVIRHLVDNAGSVASVGYTYPGKTPRDQYARAYAREKFKEAATSPVEPVKPPEPPEAAPEAPTPRITGRKPVEAPEPAVAQQPPKALTDLEKLYRSGRNVSIDELADAAGFTDTEFDLIHDMARGKTLDEIGKSEGVTKQAIAARAAKLYKKMVPEDIREQLPESLYKLIEAAVSPAGASPEEGLKIPVANPRATAHESEENKLGKAVLLEGTFAGRQKEVKASVKRAKKRLSATESLKKQIEKAADLFMKESDDAGPDGLSAEREAYHQAEFQRLEQALDKAYGVEDQAEGKGGERQRGAEQPTPVRRESTAGVPGGGKAPEPPPAEQGPQGPAAKGAAPGPTPGAGGKAAGDELTPRSPLGQWHQTAMDEAKTLGDRIHRAADVDTHTLDKLVGTPEWKQAGITGNNEKLRHLEGFYQQSKREVQGGSLQPQKYPADAKRINDRMDSVKDEIANVAQGLRKMGKADLADWYEKVGLPLVEEARADLLGKGPAPGAGGKAPSDIIGKAQEALAKSRKLFGEPPTQEQQQQEQQTREAARQADQDIAARAKAEGMEAFEGGFTPKAPDRGGKAAGNELTLKEKKLQEYASRVKAGESMEEVLPGAPKGGPLWNAVRQRMGLGPLPEAWSHSTPEGSVLPEATQQAVKSDKAILAKYSQEELAGFARAIDQKTKASLWTKGKILKWLQANGWTPEAAPGEGGKAAGNELTPELRSLGQAFEDQGTLHEVFGKEDAAAAERMQAEREADAGALDKLMGELKNPPGTPGAATLSQPPPPPGHQATRISAPIGPPAPPAEPQPATSWFRKAQDFVKSFAQQQLPATTRLSRETGEALAEAANSTAAYKSSWEYFKRTLRSGGTALGDMTDEQARELGVIWLETRLRHQREQLKRQGKPSGSVGTFVGGEGSPLETEADYQQGYNSLFSWFEQIRKEWAPEVDKNYQHVQGADPDDMPNTPSQIPGLPLNAIAMGAPEPAQGVVGTATRGMGGLKVTKPPTTRPAALDAMAYDIDVRHMMERTLALGVPAGSRAKFVRTAIENGVVEKVEPGEKPTPGFKYLGLDPAAGLHGLEKNANYYVHPDAYREVVQGLGIGERPGAITSGIKAVMDRMYNFAVMSPVEAITHIVNNLTAQFRSGMGIQLLNVFTDTIPNMGKVFKQDPGILKRVADLAEIGASFQHEPRPGILGERLKDYDPTYYVNKWTSGFISVLQKAVRVQLDDAFTKMVKLDYFEDTPTNRRNFINQAVGNYSATASNPMTQFLKDTGLQSFATATSAFMTQGIKAGFGGAINAPATSWGAAVSLRAQALGKILPILALGPVINAMRWGQAFPDGVPAFAIKTREDEEGKSHYYDQVALTGVRRGWRATGVNAILEGNREGQTTGQIIDRAKRDFGISLEHLFAGPPAQFLHTAATGENALGRKIAQTPEPGGSRTLENLKAAAKGINPLISAFTEKERPRSLPRTALENLMQSVGPLGEKTAGEHPAVRNFYDRLKGLEDSRRESPERRKGLAYPHERDYQKMHAFLAPITEMNKVLANEKAPAATKAKIRERQATLAQRALGQ